MVKSDFPLLKNNPKMVYLDNAATTQKPSAVINRMTQFYAEENANIHRGLYPLSEKATVAYEDARKTVAGFINAAADEIIFTKSATESLNLLAYSIKPLLKGRKIVLTEFEHHANLLPWQRLAKELKMNIEFIALKKDNTLDYDDAAAKITHGTALVAFSPLSNSLGSTIDAKKILALARSAGALTVIDAAQWIAHNPVDVAALGCDFLAFSGHKIYGPFGVGVLYGKRALLEQMPPFLVGGDMIREVTYKSASFDVPPRRFEAGTPAVAEAIGLGAAIRYIQKNKEESKTTENKVFSYAFSELKKIPGLAIYTPEKWSQSIISFNIEGIHPHDVAAILGEEGVCIRAGHHCCMPLMHTLGIPGSCRISLGMYNTCKDIDALIKGLKKVQRIFGK